MQKYKIHSTKVFIRMNDALINVDTTFKRSLNINMYGVDDDFVVDATMNGGWARYVNRFCNPNSIAETVC